MSDKPEKKQQTGSPDYGSSSGFSGSVPQSGMVQDDEHAPNRPPTGGGVENGSTPASTARDIKDDTDHSDR